MRVLKKYPKTTNFGQFPPSFCRKVTKKLQKARKIVHISKSLCHHLNLLSQKHLTPFFSESPISPRVHSPLVALIWPSARTIFLSRRLKGPDLQHNPSVMGGFWVDRTGR